jgi:DNA uptake protein ComE-like DNA-binding protein
MNRNDRRIALTASICLALAILLFIIVDGDSGVTMASKQTADSSQTSQYPKKGRYKGSKNSLANLPERHVETFPFDPNTADSSQLLRLGLSPFQVRNIYKYRARGGVYRRKEDFARLYGLTVKDYRRMEPFIRISSDYQPAASLVDSQRPQRDTLRYPVKLREYEHIVLNTADTSQLKKVPGIGSYYAKEIMRRGQWLGGYVSIDQLDEIDGFPQSAKQYFVIDHPSPKRLNINKLSLDQLRRHPYINYYQAKAIVDYRRLHGNITSLEQLRLSRDFTPEVIRRLEPYITY